MNAASNSCHYFRSGFAVTPCCLYFTACWKKSFVAFILKQVRKSLFHIWINTSLEDLWKISLSVPQKANHLLQGISHRDSWSNSGQSLECGFPTSMIGLTTGLLWKRAFCPSHSMEHVSFCTSKYSVGKKKDPVTPQQCCTGAKLSFNEHKYVHKTKQLQNQEALSSLWGKCPTMSLGFPCWDAAVGLGVFLRLWLESSARATARAHVSIWTAQNLFDSAILRSLLALLDSWPRFGDIESSFHQERLRMELALSLFYCNIFLNTTRYFFALLPALCRLLYHSYDPSQGRLSVLF